MSLWSTVSALAILATGAALPNVSALDAQANTGYTGGTSASSYAVSPGVNRQLLVAYAHGGATSVATATYGNQPMTFRGTVASTSGFPANVTFYTIGEAGIAAATDNVIRQTGTLTGGRMRTLAKSLQNVDQSNPVVSTASVADDITSKTINLTTLEGGFAACIAAQVGQAAFTFTGVTEEAGGEEDVAESLTYSGGSAATSGASLGIDVDLTVTSGDTDQQCALAISFRKSSGGGSGPGGSPDQAAREALFELADTKIFVSTTGSDSNSGLSEASPKRTIGAGVAIATAGDVVIVENGEYNERPTFSNRIGSANNRIWVAARNPFGATITGGMWQEARNGTVTWTDDGGGVFFASRSSRPYIGSHLNDFLMAYKTEADLRAASITAFSAIAGANRTISKPDYGFAFVDGENRVYVHLRGGANPNGQPIKLTTAFSQTIIDVNNCDFMIIDGFNIEGAGDTSAIDFDPNCASPIIRNCRITHSRHGVRSPTNIIIEGCEYAYEGFGQWARDLFALDGTTDHGVFVLAKGYYNAGDIPEAGGGSGNALLEGSIDFGRNIEPPPNNVRIRGNVIGPCFDGCRIGEHNNSFLIDNVIQECFDDAYQNESSIGHPASGNQIARNRIENCFRDGSFQSLDNNGSAFVYRNLIIHDDDDIALFGASLKMISTPPAFNVFVYQNTWIYDLSSGASIRIWDDFSSATPEEINNFYNNLIALSSNLNGSHSSKQPQSIQNNVVSGTSSGNVSALTQGGGAFVGTSLASHQLDADFALTSGSPARNAGRTLIGGHPDSGASNIDCGAFVFGQADTENYPRPTARTPLFGAPDGWPTS